MCIWHRGCVWNDPEVDPIWHTRLLLEITEAVHWAMCGMIQKLTRNATKVIRKALVKMIRKLPGNSTGSYVDMVGSCNDVTRKWLIFAQEYVRE